MITESGNIHVNEFFDTEYRWWENVYDQQLPRGFFSYEMIRRKTILLEILNSIVGENRSASILDCGCGPGGILREIDPAHHQLVGVDINSNSIAKALKNCNSIVTLIQADIEHLPFDDNSFDIAYCSGVLSYLKEDSTAVKEICRVVKPNGKVIISIPNLFMMNKFFDPYYYLVWPFQLAGRKIRNVFSQKSDIDGKYDTTMIRRYRYGQLDRLYRSCGLEKKKTTGVSFGPPTFWRREMLPLPLAIDTSKTLARLSRSRGFGFLTRLSNHWVITLEKSSEMISNRA